MKAVVDKSKVIKKKEYRHSVTVCGKECEIPQISAEAYMDYLEVKEDVLSVDAAGRYTKAQFLKMCDVICEIYGGQFTKEELLSRDSGLSASEIMTEFGMIEAVMMADVDRRVKKMQADFPAGQ